jgi:hypothetical protein
MSHEQLLIALLKDVYHATKIVLAHGSDVDYYQLGKAIRTYEDYVKQTERPESVTEH